MALRSSVLDGDKILVSKTGGSTRTWAWNGILSSAPVVYREVTTETVYRWVGLTENAATTYIGSHSSDSTTETQVAVSMSCDNLVLKSYSVERRETTVTIEAVT